MQARFVLGHLIAKPIVLLPALIIIGMIGVFNVLPNAHEAIWQDEGATLSFHVSRGMIDPFVHYNSANNHIAFSSMLAGWQKLFADPGSVFTMRLLPLGLFLLAIPATFLAAFRLGGPVCAILASLMFASSTVTANFATQLRGYGPSWLFVSLLFWCAMNVLDPRRPRAWRTGYALACLVSVALLPTNFFLSSAIAVSVAIYFGLTPENRTKEALTGFLTLLLVPLFSLLLAYAAVWQELLTFSRVLFSAWTRSGILQHWVAATFSDFLWLTPLIGAGVLIGLRELLRPGADTPARASQEFLLALLLMLGLAGVVIVMPHTPFPRTLVPFLPVWFCAVAFLMIHGVRRLLQGKQLIWFGLGAALFAAPVIGGAPVQSCKSTTGSGGAYDYDLCYQYFRDQYHPAQVTEVWAMLGKRDVPIVTNYEGYHSIRMLDSGAEVFAYTYYRAADHRVPLIVAHDEAEERYMTTMLGLNHYAYNLIADTGYFKVFGPTHGN